MKKLFSKNNAPTLIWVFFHLLIIAAFLLTIKTYGGINLDADFTTMMPAANRSEASEIAEKAIAENSGNEIFILVSHEDFQKAKETAETAYEKLKSIDESSERSYKKFKSLSLYADLDSYSDLRDFIADYRYCLLNDENQKAITSDSQRYAENALAKFFGFSMTELNPEEDPFMLDDANFQNYLGALTDSGAAVSPKDGVLARNYEGKWYVMIRGELTTEGARLANESNAVPDIYDICLPMENDEIRFVFFGTAFHSYKSSSNAVKEVTVISIVSIAAIVVLLFIVFRNLIPIFASVVAIGLSTVTAFLATHAVFGNVHMIGMIFGTSLIGSCIDYSLHYFINWKASPELKTSAEIRRHLINGLFLSLVSTEICYLLLMFAPFTMLKQIAVFSFAGIMSSFLTTIGLFPLLSIPEQSKRKIDILEKIFKSGVDTPEPPEQKKKRKLIGKFVIVAAFAVTIVTLFVKRDDLRIQNNVSNLYKPEGRVKDDSILAYNVIEYSPKNWIIISGNTAEEVLQREEKFISQMRDPFVCTSRFIPSLEKQKRSVEAAKQLIPLAETQFEYLGFETESESGAESEVALCTENFKSNLNNQKLISISDTPIPESLKSLIKMTWIGEVNGKFYSIIVPSVIADEQYYIDITSNDENLQYINKVKDVSAGLDDLTKMIVIMFAIAFVIITIVMRFFYNSRDTFKIVTIPLISVLVITTTFVLSDLPIEFFCITGVILVFGLGLDYVIYKRQNKGSKLEGFAITLSFLTTAISFGAIAFSTFVPIHVLGLSIFSGIIAAFACTML